MLLLRLIMLPALFLTPAYGQTVATPPSTTPPSVPLSSATQKDADPTVDELKAKLTRAEKTLGDWANLSRFAKDNSELPAPAKGEKRIVFYGDSITQIWKLDQSFRQRPNYINRGISGQTTPQMLVRMRADVIKLRPAAVVFLAGTNDIAGNTGPMTLEQIEDNYASIAELAKAHKIKLLFCSVLPIHNYTERSQFFFAQRSPEKIVALNQWIKDNQKQYGYTYVNYFDAVVDAQGLLKQELAGDGLHPNALGYAAMVEILSPYLGKIEGRHSK